MRRLAILALTISILLPCGCEREDLGDAPGTYTFDEGATRAAFDEAVSDFNEALRRSGYEIPESGQKALWNGISGSAPRCTLEDDGDCSYTVRGDHGIHTWSGRYRLVGDRVRMKFTRYDGRRLDLNEQESKSATYADGTLTLTERAFDNVLKIPVILRR